MRGGHRRTSHGTTRASAPCPGSPRLANNRAQAHLHTHTHTHTHTLTHIQVREEAERQVDRQRAPLHRATVTGAIAGAGPGGVLGHPAPGVGSAGSAVVCASLGLAQAERAGLGGGDGAQNDPLKRDQSRKFAVGGDGTTKAEERMRARREVGGSACACEARTHSLSPLSQTLSSPPHTRAQVARKALLDAKRTAILDLPAPTQRPAPADGSGGAGGGVTPRGAPHWQPVSGGAAPRPHEASPRPTPAPASPAPPPARGRLSGWGAGTAAVQVSPRVVSMSSLRSLTGRAQGPAALHSSPAAAVQSPRGLAGLRIAALSPPGARMGSGVGAEAGLEEKAKGSKPEAARMSEALGGVPDAVAPPLAMKASPVAISLSSSQGSLASSTFLLSDGEAKAAAIATVDGSEARQGKGGGRSSPAEMLAMYRHLLREERNAEAAVSVPVASEAEAGMGGVAGGRQEARRSSVLMPVTVQGLCEPPRESSLGVQSAEEDESDEEEDEWVTEDEEEDECNDSQSDDTDAVSATYLQAAHAALSRPAARGAAQAAATGMPASTLGVHDISRGYAQHLPATPPAPPLPTTLLSTQVRHL